MEVEVIKIGNSRGLRLSKTILGKYKIGNKLEVILEENQIILKPITTPRKRWDEAFAKFALDEQKLLMDDVFEDEEFEEWN